VSDVDQLRVPNRIVRVWRFAGRLGVESALDGRLGIAGESRPADLMEVRGEAVICFAQKVKLARIASAPLTKAAMESEPQPRAKR
jgi:hypothetical protein